MSYIDESIILTNITKVKSSPTGRLQVTFVGYKTATPTLQDTVYMFTVPINHSALSVLANELKMKDQPSTKVFGDSINIPNGIELGVRCESIERSTKGDNTKYLNRIIALDYVRDVFVDVELEVKSKDINFYDWGIVIESRDSRGQLIHSFVIYKDVLSFKPSSMMQSYKRITSSDSVTLKGNVRTRYSNYRDDAGTWRVRQRYFYNSLSDAPISVLDNLDNLKNIYASKLQAFWKSGSFESFVKKITGEWSDGFVSESEVIGDAKKLDMEIDTALLSVLFFKKAGFEDKTYTYLKSIFRSSVTYYYIKNGALPYVMIYDEMNGNLLVHDMKMAKIYILYCAHSSSIDKMSEKIIASAGLGIKRNIEELSSSLGIYLTTDVDLNSYTDKLKWMEVVNKNVRKVVSNESMDRVGWNPTPV